MTKLWAALIVIGVIMIAIALWPNVRGGEKAASSDRDKVGRGGDDVGRSRDGDRRS